MVHFHPDYEQVKDVPAVKDALFTLRSVVRGWLSGAYDLTGWKPYDTPVHRANRAFDAAVETALTQKWLR